MQTSNRSWFLIAACLLPLLISGAAAAHGYKIKSLEIVHPWTVETAGPAAAVYMTIRNSAKTPDRLLSAKVKIAAKSELRTGAASEPPKAGAAQVVVVPAGGEVKLSRDGTYLQLDGLKQKLGAYERFGLELVFEHAGHMNIEVMVEEAPTQP